MVYAIYCINSRLRKTGCGSRRKLFWGLRYFGPAKVVKERVDGGGEKAAYGHVVDAVQEVPLWAPFDAVFNTSYPGNERCAVVLSNGG
jgi:hypothetical protein